MDPSDTLLLLLHERTPSLSADARVERSDHKRLGLGSGDDVALLVSELHARGLITAPRSGLWFGRVAQNWYCALTYSGRERVSKLRVRSEETACGDPSDDPGRTTADSSRVFIIHGHDEKNTLQLRLLLQNRFGLCPVTLAAEPSKGRAIIEKFESEAASCAFAFALFTPDDFVEKDGERYLQARPNVILELGWFWGRLGRDRVCILFRKGTFLPSDLGDIGRVEFSSSIEEKVLEIEAELKTAGLIVK